MGLSNKQLKLELAIEKIKYVELQRLQPIRVTIKAEMLVILVNSAIIFWVHETHNHFFNFLNTIIQFHESFIRR